MSPKKFVPAFPTPPDGEPILGEGVSRPAPGTRLRAYRMRVEFRQSNPMVMIIKAESRPRAIHYARNRWPLAKHIEVLELLRLSEA
jgi:hypothetical protein